MILIQPPIFLEDESRKEALETSGHVCPSCSGNGWNWGTEWNERVKVTCPVCKGKRKLDAKITIEWIPAR